MCNAMTRSSMTRGSVACLAAIWLALVGATGAAFAQAGCQPTIMQPCAPAPNTPTTQQPTRKDAAQATDPTEPKDPRPRIKVDKDTDLKFGPGGIGLGRKF